MKKIKLTFHTDCGHGWLAVKRSLLKELGILSEISEYSYQKGKTVYLEEDRDYSIFLRTYVERQGMVASPETVGMFFDITDSHKDRSPIRNYDCFEINHDDLTNVNDKLELV